MSSTFLQRYDDKSAAIAQLLDEARTSEELLGIRNLAEGMRANAKIAGDVETEINCAELRSLAERRLGKQLIEAEAQGLLKRGRPPADVMAWIKAEDAKRDPYQLCPCGNGKKFKFCHGDKAPRSPFA